MAYKQVSWKFVAMGIGLCVHDNAISLLEQCHSLACLFHDAHILMTEGDSGLGSCAAFVLAGRQLILISRKYGLTMCKSLPQMAVFIVSTIPKQLPSTTAIHHNESFAAPCSLPSAGSGGSIRIICANHARSPYDMRFSQSTALKLHRPKCRFHIHLPREHTYRQ